MSQSQREPVDVGLIGLNHPHTAGYLRTLRYLTRQGTARLVGYWDPDPRAQVQRLSAFDPDRDDGSSLLNQAARVDTLDELLALEPQAGLVCLPNRDAPAVAARLLEAGVDVLVEKPVARTAAELEPLVRAAAASGARFTTGYLWRYHPGTRQIRSWRAKGLLGELWHAHLMLMTSTIRVRGPEHFLFDKEISGGGILWWLGSHWLDLVAYILDDEPAAVTADCRTLGDVDVDVEDLATVVIRFARGATATLQTGYLMEAGSAKGLALDFYGRLGRVSWRPNQGQPLRLVTQHPDYEAAPEQLLQLELPELDAYQGLHGARYVEDFLLGRSDPERRHADLEDAARVLRIAAAAQASEASGRRVEVS